jgi:hypothetical protein
VEFRDLGDGKYFPPTLPNGDVYGSAPGVSSKHPVKLMMLCDDGIELTGVLLDWITIEGVSLGDGVVVLHSSKYRKRDFTFHCDGMVFRGYHDDDFKKTHQGYDVLYALMNRVTFELQRIEKEMDIF